MSYLQNIRNQISIKNTFASICDLNIKDFPENGYNLFYSQLERGRAILQTTEQCNAYMACYSDMHSIKLNSSFKALFHYVNLRNEKIEVVDWGCGQAMATGCLHDFILQKNYNIQISKCTLIEPSEIALERAFIHINELNITKNVNKIQNYADARLIFNSSKNSEMNKIHMFSNLLDMSTINLEIIFDNIIENFTGTNYFVCVSPLAMNRLDYFLGLFRTAEIIRRENSPIIGKIFRPSLKQRTTRNISRCEIIFKVEL